MRSDMHSIKWANICLFINIKHKADGKYLVFIRNIDNFIVDYLILAKQSLK
jgi:hypothetical protein